MERSVAHTIRMRTSREESLLSGRVMQPGSQLQQGICIQVYRVYYSVLYARISTGRYYLTYIPTS